MERRWRSLWQGRPNNPSAFEFRHVLEIHAVHTGKECEGHEDRGNDGQDLHDFVEALLMLER